jgi:hypothetical protein
VDQPKLHGAVTVIRVAFAVNDRHFLSALNEQDAALRVSLLLESKAAVVHLSTQLKESTNFPEHTTTH